MGFLYDLKIMQFLEGVTCQGQQYTLLKLHNSPDHTHPYPVTAKDDKTRRAAIKDELLMKNYTPDSLTWTQILYFLTEHPKIGFKSLESEPQKTLSWLVLPKAQEWR